MRDVRFALRHFWRVLGCIAVLWSLPCFAQGSEFHVDYTVDLTTATRSFHVTTEISNVRQPQLDLALPTWTPGWYTIEDYRKNIARMTFSDGQGRPSNCASDRAG